jgi:hypothetical protein
MKLIDSPRIVENKNIKKQNTNAGTGSGCEHALGHEL